MLTSNATVSALSFPVKALQSLWQQAREHLYHAPDDAVWSWFAPHWLARENVNASCSDWGQHVSGGGKGITVGVTCWHKTICPNLVFFPSVAVHYLWETGMFRFTDTDMYQVTSLHLAASTGNTEVVRYLLRNQVWHSPLSYSLSQADQHSEISYSLKVESTEM